MYLPLKKLLIDCTSGMDIALILVERGGNGAAFEFHPSKPNPALAMGKLYERSSLLQDQIDDIHKHNCLLIEAKESAVGDQPLFLFVDRAKTSTSLQAYFQEFLLLIQKQALQVHGWHVHQNRRHFRRTLLMRQ